MGRRRAQEDGKAKGEMEIGDGRDALGWTERCCGLTEWEETGALETTVSRAGHVTSAGENLDLSGMER